MLTDYQRQQLDQLHRDEMDFVHELACKYSMTYQEVMRLCNYLHIEPAHMKAHTLENTNVFAHH